MLDARLNRSDPSGNSQLMVPPSLVPKSPMSPPLTIQAKWVVRVERDAAGFGQQTHFRIERGGGGGGGGGGEEVQLTLTAVPHPEPDPLHTRFLFP